MTKDESAGDIVGTQLITLDPKTYVTAVFAPFRERLDKAKADAAAVKIDCATPAGMKAALTHRAALRSIRVEAEAARKLRKAPILDIGKLLDSRYKEIETEIAPEEGRFDAAIVAEQSRKETERAEAEAAEAARIDRIQKRIAEIGAIPADLVGKPSIDIADALAEAEAIEITPSFEEFSDPARWAKDKAVATLKQLHAGAVAQEQAAAEAAEKIKAEKEELARLRAAQEKRDAEAKAAAAEEERRQADARAAIEAEQAAARKAIEEEARLAREKRAEEDRIADQLRAQQQAAERREREEQAAKDKADREKREALAKKIDDEQRAKQEAQRKEQERLEDEKRAVRQREVLLMDGRQRLESFYADFAKVEAFSHIAGLIRTFLDTGSSKSSKSQVKRVAQRAAS